MTILNGCGIRLDNETIMRMSYLMHKDFDSNYAIKQLPFISLTIEFPQVFELFLTHSTINYIILNLCFSHPTPLVHHPGNINNKEF